MCTVSVFPGASDENSFVLTFNRDEAVARKTSAPALTTVDDIQMIFPKDEVAGGTWLGVSEQKRVVAIMNGAYKAHKRNPPYRKSRGVVVKEFLAVDNVQEFSQRYDFRGIEPFTMIVVDWKNGLSVSERVWDTSKIHFQELDLVPRLWSSSPLYDDQMKQLRMGWFKKFQNEKAFSARGIWDFHHYAGIGDKQVDLIVDRGVLKTQSISQIEVSGNRKLFIYENLQTALVKTTSLSDLI